MTRTVYVCDELRNCVRDDLVRFRQLVTTMRRHQRAWSRDHNMSDGVRSKALERQVDEDLEASKGGKLFA